MEQEKLKSWQIIEGIYKQYDTRENKTPEKLEEMKTSEDPHERLKYVLITHDYEAIKDDEHEYLRLAYEKEKLYKERIKT